MNYTKSALGSLIGIIFFATIVSSSFNTKSPCAVQFSYLKYDVEIQDKTVGWMTSTKTTAPDQGLINYNIDSKVNVNVITNYDIQFRSESSYQKGELLKANYFTKVNGDTQSFSNINWTGAKYIGWDGKSYSDIGSKKITQSIGNLYYKEPVGISQLFSEKYMAFCPVTKSGDYYIVSFPDGKSTSYKYQNGICIWAESKQKLYKIVFRLAEIK